MRQPRTMRIPAALLASLLLGGCTLLPKEVEETPPPLSAPVKSAKEIYTVTKGDVADTVQLRVAFSPKNEVHLMFKQAGRIKQRYVSSGQQVERGQLLAELETGSLQSQIELARLNLEKAQLRLQQARDKAGLKGAIDPYEEQFLILDVKTAQVSLDSLQAQLADARIYAPFAGIVSDAVGNPGDQVPAYFTVATMQDPRELILKADVDDATASKLVVGQKAKVVMNDWGDTPLEATLVGVPNAAAAPTTLGQSNSSSSSGANFGQPSSSGGPATKQAVLQLAQPGKEPKLGQGGRAWIILTEKKGVLLLPNSAIRSYAGRKYVVVVDGDAKREVDVATGIVGETETEITKGLTEGQKVMGK